MHSVLIHGVCITQGLHVVLLRVGIIFRVFFAHIITHAVIIPGIT